LVPAVSSTATRLMSGRVVVVTGGTSGIGLEIVRGISARGAHVVLVGRGSDRVHRVVDLIRQSTGNPEVDGIDAGDLAVRAGWKGLGAELLRRYPAIHALVNNAGAFYARRETTSDGIERTFALNVLAPLGLTTVLSDRLRSSAPARVVNVASAAHVGHVVDLGNLQELERHRGFRAYGRSKLELVLLSRELARRFAGSGVTVNSLHPGFIRSGFGRNNGGAVAFAVGLAQWIGGRSPRSGARTPIRVACDPDLASVTGEYFSRGKVASGSAASRDMSMAKRLYDACQPFLGLNPLPEPPGVAPTGTLRPPTGRFVAPA
jgi:retinol dehydrogenase 12